MKGEPATLTAQGYLSRTCPSCGTAAASQPEIATVPSAESLPYEDVRARFIGFFNARTNFSYFRCRTCKLLFAPTFFSDDQLRELYASMPPNMDHVPSSALEATQEGYFRFFDRHAPKQGDFLEIGPDIGLFTQHVARGRSGGRMYLFEPNRDVHDELVRRTSPADVSIQESLQDFSGVPDGTIGSGAMIHVLDHLNDPVGYLRALRPKLRPDAVLMTVTHDEHSFLARVLRDRWPAYCLQHPQIYNTGSIRRLFSEAGYDVVRTAKTLNYFPIGYLLQHAAFSLRLGKWNLSALPLPVIGVRLGNFFTVVKPTSA